MANSQQTVILTLCVGAAIIAAGIVATAVNNTAGRAFAVVGDKDTSLHRGDKANIIAFIPDDKDPSKAKAEGMTCLVMNEGDTSKNVETLLDCVPSKVLERGAAESTGTNETDG